MARNVGVRCWAAKKGLKPHPRNEGGLRQAARSGEQAGLPGASRLRVRIVAPKPERRSLAPLLLYGAGAGRPRAAKPPNTSTICDHRPAPRAEGGSGCPTFPSQVTHPSFALSRRGVIAAAATSSSRATGTVITSDVFSAALRWRLGRSPQRRAVTAAASPLVEPLAWCVVRAGVSERKLREAFPGSDSTRRLAQEGRAPSWLRSSKMLLEADARVTMQGGHFQPVIAAGHDGRRGRSRQLSLGKEES